MSVVMAVKKNGVLVAGADLYTGWGDSYTDPIESTLESPKSIRGDGWLVMSVGSDVFRLWFEQWAGERGGVTADDFADGSSVLRLFQEHLRWLVNSGMYVPYHGDGREETYLPSNFIAVGERDMWRIGASCSPKKSDRWLTIGAGEIIAAGALEALYDLPQLSARQIVERALNTCSILNDACRGVNVLMEKRVALEGVGDDRLVS